MIPALLIMSNYLKNDGFKSVVLKANYEGTHKGINLTLFKDNSFQLLNSGPFGGNYIRGNYRFVSDTLYMESEQFSRGKPTSIFILRVNDRNQKYLQPVASDSAVPLSLYVNKDRLTNK
jgi:hypothetical protein